MNGLITYEFHDSVAVSFRNKSLSAVNELCNFLSLELGAELWSFYLPPYISFKTFIYTE